MKQVLRGLLPHAIRIEFRRVLRWLRDAPTFPKPSRKRVENLDAYGFELFHHSSKLIRSVPSNLLTLQHNKVRNLEIACARLDRLLLEPGDVFSFCSLVGRTTRRRGYLDGLETHNGELVGAPGGGLCQLANLIYWMALHLNLEITERHRHETDLFPDDERTVPFGMGATVFFNYVDLRFRNTLNQPLLLRVSVQQPALCGAFFSDRSLQFAVQLIETRHRFFRDTQGIVWRENRVAKRISLNDGQAVIEAEIAHNIGRVLYDVAEEYVENPPT